MRATKTVKFLLWLALAGTLSAQEFRATISGVVGDPTGAPVLQARVMVTNTATNVSTTTSTNSAGVYAIPYLSSGSYQITVSAQGFDTVVRQGLTLHAITISSAAPLINISPTSSAFGMISTQVNSPRAVQLGARLVW